MKRRFASDEPRRSGAVLAAVLVALIVASILFGQMLKSSSSERRLLRAQQARQQATALAESALERAVAQLATDADYTGETWQLSAADLGGREAAAVDIHVAQVAQATERRRVTVEASYPHKTLNTTRHRLTVVVDIAN